MEAIARAVANPPFLTPEEFNGACEELKLASIRANCEAFEIQFRGSGLDSFARIRRSFATQMVRDDESGAMEAEELCDQDEDDNDTVYPEIVLHQSSFTVEYDVLLSQTYCVPVLYFTIPNGPSTKPFDLDFIYQYLVPKHKVQELERVSIMGGVTMTNHPVTDTPCFFVHPCQTAEALREIIGSKHVCPFEYLQIWMGLIGSSVGLDLPKELAIKNK